MSNLQAITEAINIIEGLAEQQAMEDNWYVASLDRLKEHRDRLQIIEDFKHKMLNAQDM